MLTNDDSSSNSEKKGKNYSQTQLNLLLSICCFEFSVQTQLRSQTWNKTQVTSSGARFTAELSFKQSPDIDPSTKTRAATSEEIGTFEAENRDPEDYQPANKHEICAQYGAPGQLEDQDNLEEKKDYNTVYYVSPI